MGTWLHWGGMIQLLGVKRRRLLDLIDFSLQETNLHVCIDIQYNGIVEVLVVRQPN
jgi:hypothetical protein